MSSVAERTQSAATAVRPRRSIAGLVQGVVIAVGFVMLVGGFAVVAVDYRPYKIPTASMTPTLAIGDTVLARKADGASVGRGDIVVFHDEAWGNASMVKRVVAVGGDTVACCDAQGRLTVNGAPVDEPYLGKGRNLSTTYSVTVPEGRLFLLGDDRTSSLDSRSHLEDASGTVPASGVEARVEATVLPFSRAAAHPRAAGFDVIPGPSAHGAGPLVPAIWAAVVGAGLVVLASAAGWAVSLMRRLRGRRG